MNIRNAYETVIGIEVHAELKTRTKIFCSCSTAYGAPPNSQCCPVCFGMPGTLPTLNAQALRLGLRAGLATHCTVMRHSRFERKHYFYPDLPKGYQISQTHFPLCRDGYIEIHLPEGTRRIDISQIHLEEDAGKLLHDKQSITRVDCNRCGIPLIEIVSAPQMHSAQEAKAFLCKLRSVLLYAGVSDCKMNEGSLRCDVNLSVRKKGETALGTRTEIKNLNSFQYAARAITDEAARQIGVLEAGGTLTQQTMRFDPVTGKTHPMRLKENADDYRYFCEPDLPMIEVSDALLDVIRTEIPPLPDERIRHYHQGYGIPLQNAEILCLSQTIADYFEASAALTDYKVLAANLILTDVLRLLPGDATQIPFAPAYLAQLAQMLGEKRINSNVCRKTLEALWEGQEDPCAYIRVHGLEQVEDETSLREWVAQVLLEESKIVSDYHSGKTVAFRALTGKVMKKAGGRGNPLKIQRILKESL